MEVLHPHCAGLDVHKETVVACVRHMVDGTIKREVRTFDTTTTSLLALADWLASEGCTVVAMEATGVYWKPVWHVLSDGDFELVLANARQVKNVPGRKTDVNDATWLADLLAHGLIRASFVPDADTQVLRNLLRTRKQLVRERSSHVQRLQKTLEDANIKLDVVISDIIGMTGRAMLAALIAGETDPGKLAALAHPRIKAPPAQLREALRGRIMKHHRFLLRLHLQQIDAIDTAIAEIDREVNERIEPFRTTVELLTTIPGISELGARVIAAEIGNDMSRFATAAHLVSWAGLCPERRECRQTALYPHAKGRSLAQDHLDPMQLGCGAQEGQLHPGSVPPHPFPAQCTKRPSAPWPLPSPAQPSITCSRTAPAIKTWALTTSIVAPKPPRPSVWSPSFRTSATPSRSRPWRHNRLSVSCQLIRRAAIPRVGRWGAALPVRGIDWPGGLGTPNGTYHPQRLETTWFSKLYYNSPMSSFDLFPWRLCNPWQL